jgi:hypothetical protein
MKKHAAETDEARKRAFNRAIADLQKRELVEFYVEFAWLQDKRDKRDKRDKTGF